MQKQEGTKDLEHGNQFEYIAAEIRRQHDVVSRIDDSLDTKISIILGFIFLVLAQIAFRPELTGLATKNVPLSLIFWCGIGAIFLSILMGIKGLWFVSDFDIGGRIEQIIDKYKAGKDLNQAISRAIYNAITYDRKRGDNKAKWLTGMLISFIIGLGIMMVLEVLLYSSTIGL